LLLDGRRGRLVRGFPAAEVPGRGAARDRDGVLALAGLVAVLPLLAPGIEEVELLQALPLRRRGGGGAHHRLLRGAGGALAADPDAGEEGGEEAGQQDHESDDDLTVGQGDLVIARLMRLGHVHAPTYVTACPPGRP